jgi:excisionase family DNA binding protein
MPNDFYSIEQVAERLGLHVRTVRNYVRDGRLKARRIGKQYRIAQGDLEALTGALPRRVRHSEVSSIVEIDALPKEHAGRVVAALNASAQSRDPDDQPLRIDTIYDEERARLKLILTGGLAATASLLKFVELLLKS